MTSSRQCGSRMRAFTLVEMLVVIAIIGILAAMLIPVATHVTRNGKIKHAQAQLSQLVLWIDDYHSKLGTYPQENHQNPYNPAASPLVYELTGSKFTPGGYQTERGVTFTPVQLQSAFGVSGLVNTTRPGTGDDAPRAKNFASNLNPDYYTSISIPGIPQFPVEFFDSKDAGPNGLPNFWNYSVGHSTNHNSASFDLWISLKIGSRIYTICNWSEQPIVTQ